MNGVARLRRARDGFCWDGVERRPYKDEDGDRFRGVSRQLLFGDPHLACELRYFEIAAGGHSSLERHGHAHAVMVLRGRGRCLVGTEVRALGPHDLVTVPPWAWHQFRAGPDAPLGFLCMVNAERDRPQRPTDDDLRALKAEPHVAAFLEETGSDLGGEVGGEPGGA